MPKLTSTMIVKNMVESAISDYIWKRADRVSSVSNVTLESEKDTMFFEADAEVEYRKYHVGGTVGPYGRVFVSLVTYDRLKCTEKDKDGYWITESAKPVHRQLYGSKLADFMFDD